MYAAVGIRRQLFLILKREHQMANHYWRKHDDEMRGPYSGDNRRLLKPSVLITLVLAVWGLAGIAVHPAIEECVADTPGSEPALDVSPAKNVDEKLFLLRMLEDLYKQIPLANTSARATQTKLGQLRHFAKKVHMHIERRKFDDSLAKLFGDYVGAVDAYSDLLANIGKIQRDAVAQAERDAMKTGFDAGLRGGSAAAVANKQGYSRGNTAAIGIVTAIISAVVDSFEKDRELQEVKRQAVRRASRDVQDKFSTFLARAELTAAELTRKNGWNKGEAGFDEEKDDNELRRLYANRNFKAYWKIQYNRAKRRPRDPFIKAFLAGSPSLIASYQSEGKTREMLSCARRCVQSARLVPEGSLYDPYRLRFLRLASTIASRTYSTELRGKSFFGGKKNATAAYAVQLWDACLKYDRDPTGYIREGRAWALGSSGNIKGAVKQAAEVNHLRRKTLRYAYKYSCLLSASGDTKTAFSWFSYAVKNLGYSNITTAKTAPDLAAMRKARRKEFNDLVAVKYRWDIKYGVLNDDIVLYNDSAFAITNVVLSARIVQLPSVVAGWPADVRRQLAADPKKLAASLPEDIRKQLAALPKPRVWTRVLKVNSVAPGSSTKWGNAVAITGRRIDYKTSTLSCDQSR
jgi:hypothetical protein